MRNPAHNHRLQEATVRFYITLRTGEHVERDYTGTPTAMFAAFCAEYPTSSGAVLRYTRDLEPASFRFTVTSTEPGDAGGVLGVVCAPTWIAACVEAGRRFPGQFKVGSGVEAPA